LLGEKSENCKLPDEKKFTKQKWSFENTKMRNTPCDAIFRYVNEKSGYTDSV